MATKKMVVSGKLATRNPSALSMVEAAQNEVTRGFTKLAEMLTKEERPGPLALAYCAVDKEWKKVIESMREEIRQRLLAVAESDGEMQENGCDKAVEVESGNESFRVIRRQALGKTPESGKLKALLEEKGIPFESVCNQVVSLVLDPDKLERLVNAKKVTQAEVQSCCKLGAAALYVERI